MRPFKYEQQDLNDYNIPFYSRIGLLSVRFSEIESLVSHIIEKLINSDSDMISYLLIENNVLDKNLTILQQINNQRYFEEEKISKIISEIKQLKNIRNLFIHGVWSDVENKDGKAYMSVANHKWVKQETPKWSNGKWLSRYSSTKLTLKNLDSNIKQADKILVDLKKIWEVLDEEGENAFI
ncbi:hypothetical protein [Flavobacterium sp.]|uniref:hypothetical protein n=1 Tax=Flavobacterium sp. TaxID=239 RepID=UPI00261EBE59|nr:hypothetical protein [Flavobacterium sp.]